MSYDLGLHATHEWLGAKRQHVIQTLDGLSDADLRRGLLPSGWSLLGLVNHLAIDVERFWFHAVVAGEDATFPETEAWDVHPEASLVDVLDLYRAEAEHADDILRSCQADSELTWWPSGLADAPYKTVGEVLHHVLVETATHAGHADATRELIDGHQRLVLTQ